MKIRFSNEKKIFNIHTDGIPFLSFDMLDDLGVPNLFSTRLVRYDDIAGLGFGGIRVAVMKNEDPEEASPVCRGFRDRLARQIGSSIAMEVITDQKHTDNVIVACEEDLGVPAGEGGDPRRQSVDGVVTDIPGALLTVFGADCPSVYIADPVRKAIGLVHAGWKGTLAKIPQVAVEKMTQEFGCDPADMYAAIGPGICMDCYEMGNEVYDAFAEQWNMEDADRMLRRYVPGTESEAYVKLSVYKKLRGMEDSASAGTAPAAGGPDISAEAERPGKYHLDLREANRLTLLRAGIPEEHLAVSNVCTMCNSDSFYSYRARRMENEQCAMMVNSFG